MAPRKNAEEILLETGLIAPEQARTARQRLVDLGLSPCFFSQAVADLGFASRPDILGALSKAWGLPFDAGLTDLRPDPSLTDPARPFANLLPLSLCKERVLAPLYADETTLVLACADPLDPLTMEDLVSRTAREIRPRLVLAGDVAALIDSLDPEHQRVGPGSDLRSIVKDLVSQGRIEEAGELQAAPGPSILETLCGSSPVLLTREQALKAGQEARTLGITLPEAAILLGFATKGAILEALSKAWSVPYVDLEKEPVPLETIRRLRVPDPSWGSSLPFDEREGKLCLAMKNPSNRLLIEHIEKLTGKKVQPYLALPGDIQRPLRSITTQ